MVRVDLTVLRCPVCKSNIKHRVSRTGGTDSFSYRVDDMSHPTIAKPVLSSPSASTAPLHEDISPAASVHSDVLPQSDLVSLPLDKSALQNLQRELDLANTPMQNSLLRTRTLLSKVDRISRP